MKKVTERTAGAYRWATPPRHTIGEEAAQP